MLNREKALINLKLLSHEIIVPHSSDFTLNIEKNLMNYIQRFMEKILRKKN